MKGWTRTSHFENNMDTKDLGKLRPMKNKKPKGNEKQDYLATSLEFPEHGIQPVVFLPGELHRPMQRAIRNKNDLSKE